MAFFSLRSRTIVEFAPWTVQVACMYVVLTELEARWLYCSVCCGGKANSGAAAPTGHPLAAVPTGHPISPSHFWGLPKGHGYMPTTRAKHWFSLRHPDGAGKRGLECGHHAPSGRVATTHRQDVWPPCTVRTCGHHAPSGHLATMHRQNVMQLLLSKIPL